MVFFKLIFSENGFLAFRYFFFALWQGPKWSIGAVDFSGPWGVDPLPSAHVRLRNDLCFVSDQDGADTPGEKSRMNILASIMPGATRMTVQKMIIPNDSAIFEENKKMFPMEYEVAREFKNNQVDEEDVPLMIACEVRKSVKVSGKTLLSVGETRRGVRNVSLTLRKGEVVGLLGEPHCGAGLLLLMLSGEVVPDCGAVYFKGVNMNCAGKSMRDRISYCPENFFLWEHLTVYENILCKYFNSLDTVAGNSA